jgi:nucleotide-binding universal stress UspA family protein
MVSVRAADVGSEFARALGGEVALIHVSDIVVAYAGDTGIPRRDLIAQTEQESKKLLSGFRERLSLAPSTLEFVDVGTPATAITRAAKDWPVIGSEPMSAPGTGLPWLAAQNSDLYRRGGGHDAGPGANSTAW